MNKKTYSIIFVILLIATTSSSQTGTIKIAKPKPIPTPAQAPPINNKPKRFLGVGVGSNYTFKGINRFGYDAEILIPLAHQVFLGIKYSHENQYYNLSPYNSETLTLEQSNGKSENKSDYISMPLGASCNIALGNTKRQLISCNVMIGVEGQYLFNTKNQYDRLKYADFKKYNLGGFVSIGIPVRNRFSINLRYTKDFFDNLKDKNMYNETGLIIGKQKSKTNLLSLSVSCSITR